MAKGRCLHTGRNVFSKNKFATRINQTFTLDKHGKISSDTYFNSVSVDKWKKYTDVSTVSLILKSKDSVVSGYIIRRKYMIRFTKNVYLNKCIRWTMFQKLL